MLSWYSAFDVEVIGALSRSFPFTLPTHLYFLPRPPSQWSLGWTPVSRGKLVPRPPRMGYSLQFLAFGCLTQIGLNLMNSEAQLPLQYVSIQCVSASQVPPSHIKDFIPSSIYNTIIATLAQLTIPSQLGSNTCTVLCCQFFKNQNETNATSTILFNLRM